ncbi:MAG: molecular chaperone DnaJ [Deltaproteobacteria bacterium]|nr:molecular chaperone DnaJ [Deltaproteobacteria bacterium]
MNLDYYSILGLTKGASIDEIKKCYRRLAMLHHPDRNHGDQAAEERFKLVSEAYEVLKDDRRRDEYDRLIEHTQQARVRKGHKVHKERIIPEEGFLGEFYQGFYSSGEGAEDNGGGQGADLRCNLKISFRDAALGCGTTIMLPRRIECPDCRGAGVKAGSRLLRCRDCRGQGSARNLRGFFETCASCSGTGSIVTAPCSKCSGSGEIDSRRAQAVKVHPGVESGSRVRVSGMGAPGAAGGRAGDLIVVIHIKKHPFFVREGMHIVCEVPVPLWQAVSGCRVDVPTLDGLRSMDVPAGSMDGTHLRIRGQGMKTPHKRRGDLIVKLKVEMPVKMSRDEKRMIKKLAENIRPDAYPSVRSYGRKLEKYV